MNNWWGESPDECYWCEVTDRNDLGADLKAPKLNKTGGEYWGYSLIQNVRQGDIVFHYSTKEKAFIGVSIAGDPVEERPIKWKSHGASGRKDDQPPSAQPGWWRPLYGFSQNSVPLTLTELNNEVEIEWIKSWQATKEGEGNGPARVPFQCRSDGLRGGQGYLFKMPKDFVSRWKKLDDFASCVSELHEKLGELATSQAFVSKDKSTNFSPKDEGEYLAEIRAGKQRRTRNHEKLVRVVGEYLQGAGAEVSTPHPIDLLMTKPMVIIFEAKTTHSRTPLHAIREAVGQLHEYRKFVGPSDSQLAILLDQAPDSIVQRYVEKDLGLILLWWDVDKLKGTRAIEIAKGTLTK